MKYERLYNFISPVTGKLPIDRGYILLGDKEGLSFASPILIDVRQDIIDLKRKIGNFEELKKPEICDVIITTNKSRHKWYKNFLYTSSKEIEFPSTKFYLENDNYTVDDKNVDNSIDTIDKSV